MDKVVMIFCLNFQVLSYSARGGESAGHQSVGAQRQEVARTQQSHLCGGETEGVSQDFLLMKNYLFLLFIFFFAISDA